MMNAHMQDRYEPVILSEAKNLSWRVRFFASLRMTITNVSLMLLIVFLQFVHTFHSEGRVPHADTQAHRGRP